MIDPAGGPVPRPSRRRRWILAGIAIAIVVALAVVVVVVVVVRSSFTVDLDSASPWLERRIASAIDPLGVRRGGLTLRWTSLASPAVVRAESWTIVRSDGEPLLELPSVEIALAQRPLLRGELRPLWLLVAGPRLSLGRDAQGVFVPSADDLGGGADGEGDDGALLDAWLSQSSSGPLAGLAWARIEDGSVEVHDFALALDWGLDGLRAEISRQHNDQLELAGSFDARKDAGNAATSVAVPFIGSFDLRARRLGLDLELPDRELKSVAGLHPSLASLADLDLRLGGKARVSLASSELAADPIELTVAPAAGAGAAAVDPVTVRASARWTVGSESFRVEAAAKSFDLALLAPLAAGLAAAAPLLPPLDADLALDSTAQGVTLAATLRAPGDRSPFSSLRTTVVFPRETGPTDLAVEIHTLRPWLLAADDPALALLRGVEVPFDGTLRGTIADGTVQLRLELIGRPGRLQISGVPVEPLAIDALEIQGEIFGPIASPRIEHGELGLRAGAITATGEVRPRNPGYSARVELMAPELERGDLDRFWPAELAPEPRAQTAARFVTGTVRDLHVVAELAIDPAADPPARLDALGGSADLDGVELDVLAPQPPLRLSGSAEFDLDSVTATVEQGRLRDIDFGPGTVRLAGLRDEQPTLAVDSPWRAPLETVLALLADEPLSMIKHRERVAGVTGATRGELHLELPLGEATEPKRARIRARGDLDHLEWADGPLGLQVSRGELSFNHSGDEIELTGKADAESSPTRFSLRHRFDAVEPRDTLHLSARIDEATARALGVPEQTLVDGVVDLEGTYTARSDGTAVVEATVDLTPATIELAKVGVAKPAGEAARARLDAALERGRLTVRSLVVDGRQLAGTARLEATTGPFRVESATVDSLRLGETQLSGSLSRRPDGVATLAVDATRLDLRMLLGAEPAAETSESARDTTPAPQARVADSAAVEDSSPGVPFDFEAKVDSMLLLGDVETGRFVGSGSWDGERWSRLAIDGAFDPATPVSLDFDRSVQSGRLRFETSDLGRLLSTLVSHAEIRGGNLLVTAAYAPAGDRVVGHLSLRSFTLIKMPVFASILQLGTLDSLFGMFQDQGLEFKTLDADLEWDGRLLSVSRARALGGGIAFTGDGDFDLAAGTIDFAGTVGRMGRLQRMIGKIPALNTLVLGRDRGGVIATGFHLRGAVTDPTIEVEPLSTFTPGFLRGLFGDVKSAGDEGSERSGAGAPGQAHAPK